MKICIAIYSPPEFFPPTLNAIDFFSSKGFQVNLVYNNQFNSTWNYSNNVYLFPAGKRPNLGSSIFYKLARWFLFVKKLYNAINGCDICIVYDPIPLLSYFFVSFFNRKSKILWYHNHDIYELNRTKKYSLQWLAITIEQRLFNKIDLFTLPSEERRVFFPLSNFPGQVFVVPNYPSLAVYEKLEKSVNLVSPIRILYQGTISPGHGIEEFIDLLPININGNAVEIVLVGPISLEYKQELLLKCKTNQVVFIDRVPYSELFKTTIQCTIGLAVFTSNDIMNSTLGTASNKIYEYAACGLPIIYYENPHFLNYLSEYKWAVSTNLSAKSILVALNFIVENYCQLSTSARNDFLDTLNFENVFKYPFESIVQNAKIRALH